MITRLSSDPGGLRPDVVELLSTIPLTASRHTELEVRPPAAAYNSSLQDVFSAFSACLDVVDAFPQNTRWIREVQDWEREIVPRIERLLYKLAEHLEHCLHIATSLLPEGSSNRKDHRIKVYESGVTSYKKHVAAVVNAIKHKQRRIRGIVMYEDDQYSLGYYIETVGTFGGLLDPVMLPDPTIHAHADTAFSINRDLRYHLSNVYLVGRHLGTAVAALSKVAPSGNPIRHADLDERIFAITRRVANLPSVFYPDELRKPVPSVGAGEAESGERTVWFEYPSIRLHPTRLNGPRISVSTLGDGTTRNAKLPYFLARSWR